jgi:hypothetical protein
MLNHHGGIEPDRLVGIAWQAQSQALTNRLCEQVTPGGSVAEVESRDTKAGFGIVGSAGKTMRLRWGAVGLLSN